MFSLQQGDELVFQISSIEQDLMSSHASLETTGILTPPKRKRKKSLLYSNHDHQQEDKYGGSSTCTTTGSNGNKEKIKMTAHRDVERLRRKEMAELYASLRSLLPLEYVKVRKLVPSFSPLLSLSSSEKIRPSPNPAQDLVLPGNRP